MTKTIELVDTLEVLVKEAKEAASFRDQVPALIVAGAILILADDVRRLANVTAAAHDVSEL